MSFMKKIQMAEATHIPLTSIDERLKELLASNESFREEFSVLLFAAHLVGLTIIRSLEENVVEAVLKEVSKGNHERATTLLAAHTHPELFAQRVQVMKELVEAVEKVDPALAEAYRLRENSNLGAEVC